jgi:uncharacterized protein YjbI with pentapeptide repeats
MPKSLVLLSMLGLSLFVPPASAAPDMTAEEVRQAVASGSPARPVDLSGKSLDNLDLSNLDLRRASFAGANLFGAKLVGADLSGANLSGANLNLAWIMRAKFDGANLSKASLKGLVVSPGLDISLPDAPSFVATDFSGAEIQARLSRFDLRQANFTNARLGADMKNQSMGLMRTDLSGANLANADFTGADLGRALLRFANLSGASLARANLYGVDLSGADLTGADLSGADATEADFGGAVLTDAKGLASVKGLAVGETRR